MADGGAPKITLNIFLLKKKDDGTPWSKNELLAKEVTAIGKSKVIKTTEHALKLAKQDLGTLYIRPFTEKRPEWVGFIESGIANPAALAPLKNKSVSAILVTETKKRQFVLAFGHGRHMIDQCSIEYRFGIKTVLNAVEPTKIVSIDRQNFDATPKLSRTQAVKKSPISEYGVDPSRDLLRAITGEVKRKFKSLGEVVAGMDSFKTSVPLKLEDLHSLLEKILERSQSKDYLKAEGGRDGAFAWIDMLQHITDPVQTGVLDEKLWENFWSDQFTSMWLAIPEILDWEGIAGFAYTRAQADDIDDLASALDVEDFKATFRADATFETLRKRSLYLVHAADGRAEPYSAYRSIYAEVSLDGNLYVLNAGAWYQVEKSFRKQVDDHFEALLKTSMPFADPFIEYDHKDEEAYNEAVAAKAGSNYTLLDRKQIQFGGNHSSIEVCDLFMHPKSKTAKGQLVHVKRGRSSATLSHLFAQGLTSSSLLAMEEGFVEEVNRQLKEKEIAQLPKEPVPADFDVVYAIVDGEAGSKLNIPFFSKVNLQNCARSLRGMGYNVRLLHIPESVKHLAKVAAKKAAKRNTP